MKSYRSKVYSGKNFDAIVTSYYGPNSYPSDFYEVCYRVHADDPNNPFWQYRIDCVYQSKSAALRRAREIARNF